MENVRSLVKDGLRDRYEDISYAMMARAESEVQIIESAGKAQSLLSAIDFLDWMKTREIVVGPGWSITPGFLVSYALGLSDLDPLTYGLQSEQCRGPNGTKGFEIWLSADGSRFSEILDYLREVFGAGNVEHEPHWYEDGLQCGTVKNFNEAVFHIIGDSALTGLHPGSIPLDDTAAWDFIAGTESTRIFTGEDAPVAGYAAIFHPDTIVELASLKALHICRRPELVNEMIARKKSPCLQENSIDVFAGALAETYDIPVFREDMLRAIEYYAGYDLFSAGKIWRELCKKKTQTIKDICIDFLEHAGNLGKPNTEAISAFDLIEKNSVYLGIKSHYLGWALVRYRKAFMNVRSPQETA